jgi:oxygen-independent coproporphyrinogen III oxidase
MEINKDLLLKYNLPVPRYTSYPPANYFQEGIASDRYAEFLEKSNDWLPENISFYIHIPFCRRLCLYCGCNSFPMPAKEDVEAYIRSLKLEINAVVGHLDKKRKISQIHYGGGTPNSIPIRFIKEINQILFEQFQTIDNPEIAIECHPGYLDETKIEELKLAGFNRFSMGIQDFNNQVLHTINRKPSALNIDDVFGAIRNDWPRAINLDFIYGLPGQDAKSFAKTIEQAIALKPERLVTFSYAHVPWVNKNQKLLEKYGVPGPEEKFKMFQEAYSRLIRKGYTMIGMDHYVLDNDELYLAQKSGELHRNFQGYSSRRTTGQVYAFGISAISQLQYGYFQNTKSLAEYQEMVNKSIFPVKKGYLLREDERIIREVLNELMCNKRLDFNKLSEKLKISSDKIISTLVINEEKLSTFEKDGIIERDAGSIQISELGKLFVRNVAASFDPLMVKNTKSFSKSV